MNTLIFAFLNSFALDFLTTIAIAFLAVRLGILLIDGNTNLLPALIVLLISPEFFLPMKQAATDYHATLNGQLAYEDIIRIVKMGQKNKQYKKEFTKMESISLKNLSFSKDESDILKDISFNIKASDKVCIVGPSGSGKTTLISLLSGFNKETSGSIMLNDEKVTLSEINWSSEISYISQFPFIFPDTIKNNILFYMEGNVSEEKLYEICALVGLKEFIEDLDNKYDTLIGESGLELSGGQAQRIAIARALASDRKIVILDEPTSHLDIETEFEIKEKLLELFEGRTVIIATHRLHWLNNMDYILHLEGGKLIDFEEIITFKNTNRYKELRKTLIGERNNEK